MDCRASAQVVSKPLAHLKLQDTAAEEHVVEQSPTVQEGLCRTAKVELLSTSSSFSIDCSYL